MTSIKEVASRAGVSIGTVSNAFKHPEKVAEKTRQQIMEVATELGFSPSPLAGALVTSRTNIIGLLVSHSRGGSRGTAVNEFTKKAVERDYLVLLAVADMDEEKEKQAVDYFIKYKVDGVVVYADYVEGKSKHFEKLVWAGIPCVVFKRYNQLYENIVVSADKALQELTEQLKIYEHWEVGIVTTNMRYSDGSASIRLSRIRDFKEKLEKVGIPLPDDNIIQVEHNEIEMGEKAADKWLATKKHLPTVFLCFYDLVAIGLMNRLQERGYQIPEDVSVVAYGETSFEMVSKPKLSVISTDEVHMMLKALDILLERIERPDKPVEDHIFTHEFFFRESLGPARKKQDKILSSI